jgi:hypothetical protein
MSGSQGSINGSGNGDSSLISIHKLPASITFAPMKHAPAVTVEPFKFSSRQDGAAYELKDWTDVGEDFR